MTQERFIQLVEQCQPALRRLLTALCTGDSQSADDIAQDAIIKAYVNYDKLEDKAKFSAWLYKIAYNVFLNRQRGKKATIEYSSVPYLTADSRADDSFRYQALYSALALLPDKERMSILLFYLQGYSVEEISSITNFSQSAVRQQLSRGRKHLRTLIEQD